MPPLLEGLFLELTLTCRRCRNPVPVNGLCEALSCPHCSESITYGADLWLSFFDPETLAEVLALPTGGAQEMTSFGGAQASGSLAHLMPRCPKCKTATPPEQLERYASAGGYSCSCGTWLTVRPAPPMAKAIVPGALWVVNEHLGGRDDPNRTATEPVLFACIACGGALKVNGETRTVPCIYCEGENFLPEALWQRLHPVPVLEAFFIVTALSDEDRLRIRMADGDEAVRLARHDTLPRDLYEKLAKSADYEARAAVAGNPSAPPDLLAALTSDTDSDVRVALAANPGIDDATVRRLAHDDDDDVRAAIATRSSLPPELLAALIADSDWEVRRAAVPHPAATTASLSTLAAGETDRDVLKALALRQDLHVDVLRALGQSRDRDAKRTAAAHPNTPADVLSSLADDYHSDTRSQLAANPSTPGSALLKLAQDSDSAVASAAQANPGFEVAVKTRRTKRVIAVVFATLVLGCAGVVAVILGVAGVATDYLQIRF